MRALAPAASASAFACSHYRPAKDSTRQIDYSDRFCAGARPGFDRFFIAIQLIKRHAQRVPAILKPGVLLHDPAKTARRVFKLADGQRVFPSSHQLINRRHGAILYLISE